MKRRFIQSMAVLFFCLSILCLSVLCLSDSSTLVAQSQSLVLESETSPANTRLEDSAKEIALSKAEAQDLQERLFEEYQAQLRTDLQESWKNKVFRHDEFEMKFEYRIFGEAPEDGRRLYISMHGGGNAPARVNDQQWQNQIRLYEPKEGVYLAPRAPTNEWNLWHLPHIDVLFDHLIQAAVLFENVNRNRVYLMGYSAGGDGVYQLAPRIADRLAAAAMMAGHPNETSPLGLRNIGFTLHVGADDNGFNRNQVAREWKEKLAALLQNDPSGYIHEVHIHEGKGHWMDREDRVAVEWMARFTRNPLPDQVVWKQDDVHHPRFYWLAVDEENRVTGSEIHIRREQQIFTVEKTEGLQAITILLNDRMVDMDQPVTVKMNEKTLFEGIVHRNRSVMQRTLLERGDRDLIFSGEVLVRLN